MWIPSETASVSRMRIAESNYGFIEIIVMATGSGHKNEPMEF